MQQLLKKIYDNKKLTKALKIMSHGCVVIHIAAYMYLLYTAARNSYKELIGAAFITFLPFLIVSLMRAKIKTSRPYEIYGFYEIKPKDREGGSFPSRHVFSAFAVATLAAVYSVPLSVFAVRNRKIGKAVSLFSILIMSLPSFMIAVFLVMIFSVHLKIFPPAGYISIGESFSGFLRTMFLPSFTLSLLHSSLYLRIFRKALDENLAKPFSMAMAAMGMKKKDLVMKSAFAPSLPVLASLLAGSFATAASGSAVTETIFAIPGIGSLLVDAALTRDTALSGILIIFIALAVSLMSAVAELLFFILDPRTRRR